MMNLASLPLLPGYGIVMDIFWSCSYMAGRRQKWQLMFMAGCRPRPILALVPLEIAVYRMLIPFDGANLAGGEVLLDDLLSPRKSVAPAHLVIIADRMGVSHWTAAAKVFRLRTTRA